MTQDPVLPRVLESHDVECGHLRALLRARCGIHVQAIGAFQQARVQEAQFFSRPKPTDPEHYASAWPDSVPFIEPAKLTHHQLLVVLAAMGLPPEIEEEPATPKRPPGRFTKFPPLAMPSRKRGVEALGLRPPDSAANKKGAPPGFPLPQEVGDQQGVQPTVAPDATTTVAPPPGVEPIPAGDGDCESHSSSEEDSEEEAP